MTFEGIGQRVMRGHELLRDLCHHPAVCPPLGCHKQCRAFGIGALRNGRRCPIADSPLVFVPIEKQASTPAGCRRLGRSLSEVVQ